MRRIASGDGVAVAVHELADDPALPPLLLSHATGFHAHCYLPIARALGDRYHCVGLDHRGHGETVAPDAWEVDWTRFGVDTLNVAAAIAPDGGLVGVGHSMGGASLLMAAARRPELFDRLVLFEPIAHQPRDPVDAPFDLEALPIVQGARRRRRRFDSFEDAYANFADKPPMSLMTPEVLRLYVDHGFREVDDADGHGVVLRCLPELEAGIFVNARHNGVWELLPHVEVPVLVIAGRVDENQPSAWCEAIAERLPHGEYVELPHLTHFGPFSHPDEIAELVLGRP